MIRFMASFAVDVGVFGPFEVQATSLNQVLSKMLSVFTKENVERGFNFSEPKGVTISYFIDGRIAVSTYQWAALPEQTP